MKNYNIYDLLPQRPPIVMVDNLIQCDATETITQFLIKEDNIFCELNTFLEAGLIENMAQTAAARMGYMSKLKGGKPQIGYIGAVKNLRIFFQPQVNTLLTTKMEIVSEVMGFTIIRAQVECNGQIAASCEMRIFLVEE